jgi:hypothetical protein
LRHRRWAGAMKTNRELAEVREWRSVSSNSNSDDSTSKLLRRYYVPILVPSRLPFTSHVRLVIYHTYRMIR